MTAKTSLLVDASLAEGWWELLLPSSDTQRVGIAGWGLPETDAIFISVIKNIIKKGLI